MSKKHWLSSLSPSMVTIGRVGHIYKRLCDSQPMVLVSSIGSRLTFNFRASDGVDVVRTIAGITLDEFEEEYEHLGFAPPGFDPSRHVIGL